MNGNLFKTDKKKKSEFVSRVVTLNPERNIFASCYRRENKYFVTLCLNNTTRKTSFLSSVQALQELHKYEQLYKKI